MPYTQQYPPSLSAQFDPYRMMMMMQGRPPVGALKTPEDMLRALGGQEGNDFMPRASHPTAAPLSLPDNGGPSSEFQFPPGARIGINPAVPPAASNGIPPEFQFPSDAGLGGSNPIGPAAGVNPNKMMMAMQIMRQMGQQGGAEGPRPPAPVAPQPPGAVVQAPGLNQEPMQRAMQALQRLQQMRQQQALPQTGQWLTGPKFSQLMSAYKPGRDTFNIGS